MILLPSAAGTMNLPPLIGVPGGDVVIDATWQRRATDVLKIVSPAMTSASIGPRIGAFVERMKSANAVDVDAVVLGIAAPGRSP